MLKTPFWRRRWGLLCLVVFLLGCAITVTVYAIMHRFLATTPPSPTITHTSPFQEFALPSPPGDPREITRGPDGALWFIEEYGITRITRQGQTSRFMMPSSDGSVLIGITKGPDGALWFTEQNQQDNSKIGRITVQGQISEFPLPTNFSGPRAITTGPDGALWFTELEDNKIGRISP